MQAKQLINLIKINIINNCEVAAIYQKQNMKTALVMSKTGTALLSQG